MLKITLDTNTFRMDRVSPAILKIRGGADVVVTTTTAREIGSVYDPSLSQVQVKPELFVLDESRLATGVLVSAPDATLFERVIDAISNGSFPKPGRRATLTPGEQDQRRDAMIFCTHVREGRDIFVTDDVKAFGEEGSPQRQRVSALAPQTKIMTPTEFERFCGARRRLRGLSAWKHRLAFAIIATLILISVTRNFWIVKIAQGLVCPERLIQSDLIVVEPFDRDYLLFERAATLQRAGFAARVLIPVQVSHQSEQWNKAAIRVSEVMAGMAQVHAGEIMPIRALEPISLNTVHEIRALMTREHLSSAIVVTSGFRSERSSLIYKAVLAPVGISVSCVPVFTGSSPQNWSHTWHGIQEVTEQFVKLQYYRFYVLLKPV